MRIGVVFGHKLPRLCASAHLLRMFSHVLPPFRWLYGWIVYAELSYFLSQVSDLLALINLVYTLTSASSPN